MATTACTAWRSRRSADSASLRHAQPPFGGRHSFPPSACAGLFSSHGGSRAGAAVGRGTHRAAPRRRTWSFEFDNAKKRAGLCNYTEKRISVSRYLAHDTTTTRSTRSCCTRSRTPSPGRAPGTGRSGRRSRRSSASSGSRTHDGEVAHELAPWVGRCPAGHEHFRYREPSRPLSCGLCRRGFDRANLIVWRRREITSAVRRRAASAAAE